MIVRNEAGVLERCLEAASSVFDAASLCDTGSSDQTAQLASAWFDRHGIPARVNAHTFENFGHNRTLSILAAQQMLRDLGWDLENSYLLFLDADMVLEVGEGFRRDTLEKDVYSVVQRNGTLVYPNTRLARASLEARFVGPTHEYFEARSPAEDSVLESLTIDDRGDGGSRADKFERDRLLLEAELARDPNNARAMFYLAQTLRDQGDFGKALFWYRQRLKAGGWPEEVWYAQYAIGRMYLKTGETAAAVAAMHKAIHLDPRRAEPFFHLARHFRNRGRHAFAVSCARQGLELPFPVDRALFLERDVYAWGLRQELSISSYYVSSRREEGAAANERLALQTGVPVDVSATATNNAVFYAEPLPGATYIRIVPTVPPNFNASNPGILKTQNGYLLNCRAVSYRVDSHQHFVPMESDGILRTRNILMRLDRDLRFLDQTEMTGTPPPVRDHVIQGMEDCRLVAFRGQVAFTCTTADLHPDGAILMSLVTLDDRFHVDRHVPLRFARGNPIEKNWLPFTDGTPGELRAVYGYEPLIILAVDPETGRCEAVAEHASGRNLFFRGSAGPVDLPPESGGGKLLLVHEVAFHGRRYYLQRFVAIDSQSRITSVSRPFIFFHRGIEFVCGATLSHDGEELLITFGVEEREAWLCRLPLRDALALLRPLPD